VVLYALRAVDGHALATDSVALSMGNNQADVYRAAVLVNVIG